MSDTTEQKARDMICRVVQDAPSSSMIELANLIAKNSAPENEKLRMRGTILGLEADKAKLESRLEQFLRFELQHNHEKDRFRVSLEIDRNAADYQKIDQRELYSEAIYQMLKKLP